jgi:hypothetical protein
MAQGLTGFAGGRPEPQAVIRLFSFLADKADVPVTVSFGDSTIDILPFLPNAAPAEKAPRSVVEPEQVPGETTEVPLIALAHGRSGDKGDSANIGVLARRPEFVPVLRRQLTDDAVRAYFAHFVKGEVERFEWPGLDGFNFLLHQALGGGGVSSLRHDPQGKALAQVLMDFAVSVPVAWVAPGGPLAAFAKGEAA